MEVLFFVMGEFHVKHSWWGHTNSQSVFSVLCVGWDPVADDIGWQTSGITTADAGWFFIWLLLTTAGTSGKTFTAPPLSLAMLVHNHVLLFRGDEIL